MRFEDENEERAQRVIDAVEDSEVREVTFTYELHKVEFSDRPPMHTAYREPRARKPFNNMPSRWPNSGRST